MGKRRKVKRKDFKAAKKRGLIDAKQYRELAPKRVRRVCVTCGRKFWSFGIGSTRMFGCACCAYACNEKLDRTIARGVWVVVIWTGQRGFVQAIRQDKKGPYAIVAMEDGEMIKAQSNELEKIHGLAVLHERKCRHGKMFISLKGKDEEEEPVEDQDEGGEESEEPGES